MSKDPTDKDLEWLKAAIGGALGDKIKTDGPLLTGEAAKEAVMRRATELTQTGLPFDRAIRQAKQELGM